MTVSAASVVEAHRAAGAAFTARGVQSFVREAGDGEPVVLLHGLPASSFLYRKVLPELASRGLRGIAFDLPGLGLAGRPTAFDYSISGLGVFCHAAVDELGLGRFHLVVHDAGGPVGFEMAARVRDRIRSLTILNTVAELTDRPFPGEVLARVTGRLGGPLASPAVWRRLMYRVGILDRTAVPPEEVDAYRLLTLGPDGGAGYLAIMRRLRDERRDYRRVVRPGDGAYPVQIVWGVDDPILKLRTHGMAMLRATGLPALHAMPGRHYLQEDHAPQIAELIARHAGAAAGG